MKILGGDLKMISRVLSQGMIPGGGVDVVVDVLELVFRGRRREQRAK
jgi:hypothetical protein